jgi:hypothetical protein
LKPQFSVFGFTFAEHQLHQGVGIRVERMVVTVTMVPPLLLLLLLLLPFVDFHCHKTAIPTIILIRRINHISSTRCVDIVVTAVAPDKS